MDDEPNISKDNKLVKPNEMAPVLQGDPKKVIDFAQKAAWALQRIIKGKSKPVIINNEQYLEFEDWQTIGRFYGITVGVEWCKRIKDGDKFLGWEARAVVFCNGETISSAESACMIDEPRWASRPEFQIRSMAQTRACAKALRNVLAFVPVLAGYKTTPAEEMEDVGRDEKITQPQMKKIFALLNQRGKDKEWFEEWCKKPIEELTKHEASGLIDTMEKKLKEGEKIETIQVDEPATLTFGTCLVCDAKQGEPHKEGCGVVV
ncbi:hypothetical protein IH981_02130 [Patescibacteria group bacterium]|nr:hypothetical protein [Patescibacteria group bacterium]